MTHRLRSLAICALLFSFQGLSGSTCAGSWLSTPSNTCSNSCNVYCSQPKKSQCTHWKSSPCDLGCSNRGGVNFGADFLYWTTCQENLDYAVDHATDIGAPLLLGDKHTHFLEYEWSPGVRGYLGLELCGFAITGQYAWFKNRAEGYKDFTNEEAVLVASLLHPNTNLRDASIAYGLQDLWYQAADLLFSKEIEFCDDKLILRPFVGPRWIKIKQEQKVTYEGEDFVDNAEYVSWESSVSGVGVHVGADLYYRWVCGFGMFGQLAGTVVGGRTDNTQVQVSLDSSGNAIDPPSIYLDEKQNVCIPGYQLQAGFTWETCCCDSMFIRFRFCYEFNQWLNTPEIRRYHYQNEGVSNAATDGSIALHGGTFGFDLRF